MNPNLRLLLLLASLAGAAAAAQPSVPESKSAAPKPAATAPSEDEEENEEPVVAAPSKPDPAADKFWEAVRLMRSKVPADQTAGAAALKAASDLEYTHAQLLLADCYYSGTYGVSRNSTKAANLFRLAAERGNGYAMVAYGACCAMGLGTSTNEKAAIKWLEAAVDPKADFSRPVPPPDVAAAMSKQSGEPTVAGGLVSDPVATTRANAHFFLGLLYAKAKKMSVAQPHFVAGAVAGPNGASGNFRSAIIAAVIYAFGEGVPRDMNKANELLEQSRKLVARTSINFVQNSVALKMNDDFAAGELEEAMSAASAEFMSAAQLNIARHLADKKSESYDFKEAAKWYEVAAENGQVWAMIPLAFIELHGDVGPADPVKAFHWFEKAGGGPKPKVPLATADLAICYYRGIGTPKDPAKAADLFRQHREEDFVCYLGSIGEVPMAPLTLDDAVALNRQWAKERKDPTAQYLLGVRYLTSNGVERDEAESVYWLNKAAKARNGAALSLLGFRAESESEFRTNANLNFAEEDMAKAVEYYKKSSEAGDAEGTLRYGVMFHSGRGVKADEAKAEGLFLKSAQLDAKYALPHYYLGLVYENRARAALASHNAAAADKARTAMLEQYDAAARLGSASARASLGALYYQGVLVPKDFRRAYTEFEAAAADGSAGAHFGLGLMHEQGEGVPVTYAEAAYHYRLAALDGHPEALRRLVNFYLTGQGVSQDLDRALFWLIQMYRRGNTRVLTTYCDVMLKRGAYDNVIPLLKELIDSPDEVIRGFAYDRLSYCYDKGLGVKASPGKAKKYKALAVKHGDGNALAELGVNQVNSGNVAEGIVNLKKAAPNSRHANYVLGMLYYFGNKVPRNEQVGLEYMRAAAEDNHADAMYFLATLTYHHKPGGPTLDKAIDFAQRAAVSGNKEAAGLHDELEQMRKKAADAERN